LPLWHFSKNEKKSPEENMIGMKCNGGDGELEMKLNLRKERSVA